ncbi:hypothetical protein ACFX2K_009658 [Malus domestica]
MVQQQAKKIENLSLMVLYSNRDRIAIALKRLEDVVDSHQCQLKNSRQASNFAFTRFLSFIWSNWRWQPKIITSQGIIQFSILLFVICREINRAVMYYEYPISLFTLRVVKWLKQFVVKWLYLHFTTFIGIIFD